MTQNAPIKILYIEDNIDDQIILKRVITKNIKQRVKFDASETATKGYEKIQNNNYDVIFLDYKLPDKTGLELLEQIRQDGNNTPVFFLTGMGNEKIAVEAMRRGVDEYIIKSEVQSPEFISSLKQVLEKDSKTPVDEVGLTEKEKKIFHEFETSGIQVIEMINTEDHISYTGIPNFVSKNGFEATSYILSRLEEKGKIVKTQERQIISCPSCNCYVSTCESIYVCDSCSSKNISRIVIMSHPHCGYTGNKRQYITENGLVCPNCKTLLKKQSSRTDTQKDEYLIIGSAFECNDCKTRFNRPLNIHICSICGEEFSFKNMGYIKVGSYTKP